MERREINKTIRKVLNLSMRELADRVETTKQTISNYERGKCKNSRVLERVIEWELNIAIEDCSDANIKSCCKILEQQRT